MSLSLNINPRPFIQGFIFLLIVIMFMTACTTEHSNVPEEPSMDALDIPANFNYESTKEVALDFKMPSAITFGHYKGRLDIYDEEGGKLLHSGSFNDLGIYAGKLTIPATQEQLFFSSIAVDTLISIPANPNNVSISLDLTDHLYLALEDTVNTSGREGIIDIESDVLPYVINGDFSENDFANANNWSHFTTDQKWYFATNGVGRTPMTWFNEDGNGFIGTTISSRAQFGASQTIAADPGQLITFQVDIKADGDDGVRSRLWLHARNARGRALKGANLWYTNPDFEWTTKSLAMTMPANTAYATVALLGGDWTNKGRILFDNASAGGIVDTDGDGIEDTNDDFPEDSTKAYSYTYPNDEDYGTLAFEDTWPSMGDYDFNDMVVDYQFTQFYNADNEVTSMNAEFIFRAAGAIFHNGFGFQMDVAPEAVRSVTGNSVLGNYITTMENGVEAGQSKATIIVVDDLFDVLSSSAGETVNVTLGENYVEPETLYVTIEFEQPMSIEEVGYAPFNPFLIVGGERGKEIHLPGYAPTDLVDPNYFGTFDDDTQSANSKYYMTTQNLPWAINLPQSFSYPQEGKTILEAYTHYAQWARSGGFSFMDWYTDRPGYIKSDAIYSR